MLKKNCLCARYEGTLRSGSISPFIFTSAIGSSISRDSVVGVVTRLHAGGSGVQYIN